MNFDTNWHSILKWKELCSEYSRMDRRMSFIGWNHWSGSGLATSLERKMDVWRSVFWTGGHTTDYQKGNTMWEKHMTSKGQGNIEKSSEGFFFSLEIQRTSNDNADDNKILSGKAIGGIHPMSLPIRVHFIMSNIQSHIHLARHPNIECAQAHAQYVRACMCVISCQDIKIPRMYSVRCKC